MSPSVLRLSEQKDGYVARERLSEEDAIALHNTRHFEVRFPSPLTNGQYVIRPSNWIGHVPVSSTLTVQVVPKVPVRRLFAMLEVAFGLKSFSFLPGESKVESVDDLLDNIALILAQRVLGRIRKGLYKAYVSKAEQLGVVRGRIDVRNTLAAMGRADLALHCEYEELTTDLIDNQILLWTLHVATRMVARSDVRMVVARAHRALLGEIQCAPVSPGDCIGRAYLRLNADYRPMHGLCRLLLTATGPDVLAGDHAFIPFTLNMAALFEEFVATWLRERIDPAYLVKDQHNVKLQSNMELRIEIDLLVLDSLTGKPVAVFDTKYKDVTEPSHADINQVVAYAVQMGVKRAYLIYPSPLYPPFRLMMGDIEVRSLCFDTGLDIEDAGAAFLSSLYSGFEAS